MQKYVITCIVSADFVSMTLPLYRFPALCCLSASQFPWCLLPCSCSWNQPIQFHIA